MKVSINGTAIDHATDGIHTLEQVPVSLKESALPAQNMISRVVLNGSDFSELYPGQSADVPSERIRTIDIHTVHLTQFAAAALKDCRVHLERIRQGARETAERFRLYDEFEANERLAELLEAVRNFLRFMHTIHTSLGIDLQTVAYQETSAAQELARFECIIDAMYQTQQEGDLILLADQLEYELLPGLECWDGLTARLADTVAQEAAHGACGNA